MTHLFPHSAANLTIRLLAEVVLRTTSGFADDSAEVIATRVLAPSVVRYDRGSSSTEMPNVRYGGAASGRQMPMLADAACMAVVGTVCGMVDANELLSARPRGPLNLDDRLCCRRRAFVGGAVALAALLLDKL